MDILMLGTDQQTITPYLWSHGKMPCPATLLFLIDDILYEFIFKPATSFRYPRSVVNVVPGDFNNDGRLDLLVMSHGQTHGETAMAVYFSDLHAGFGMLPAWLVRVN
jgi:integrin alpha FG-GAP repeat containing protein 1